MNEQHGSTARRLRTWSPILVVAACVAALSGRSDGSSHPFVSFSELSHSADVILIGTVSEKQARLAGSERMILTDVTFDEITVIHQAAEIEDDLSAGVTLTFAGGELDGRRFRFSGVPVFEIGERCVLFARYDGKTYANPLVGGDQGLFRVAADATTDELYALNAGGGAIVTVDRDGVHATPRIARIEGGVALFEERPPMAAAIASDPRDAVTTRETPVAEEAMTLDAFVTTIQENLAAPPPARRVLRRSKETGGQAGELPAPPPGFNPSGRAPGGDDLDHPGVPPDDGSEPKGGHEGGIAAPLCYCGYHDLYLVMEQYPVSFGDWYVQNDYAMSVLNQYMDVYRYTASDGNVGHNGESEFLGWLDSGSLMSMYGWSWDDSPAVCWNFDVNPAYDCLEISESDIAFNPAYVWRANFADAFNNFDVLLYMPSLMHELGHSWGMQNDPCIEDYAYDQLSVMHGPRPSIVEDGRGIHATDAWAIRGNYDDQTPILTVVDVGIESYYASSGLHNATTDTISYTSGDPISIQSITVESMSSMTRYDVRFRFWLSTDRVFSDDDTQVGGYVQFDENGLPAHGYWTGTINTTVPNVPSGDYNVILTVNTGGAAYTWDDYTANNVTFMPQPIYVSGSGTPTNDDCQDYLIVQDGLINFNTLSATTDGETNGLCGGDGQIHNDLWYAYQATNCGRLFANTCPNFEDPEDPYAGIANFDTEIAIYAFPPSCPPGAGYVLGCNDNDPFSECGVPPNYLSYVSVPVQQDAWYLIRLGGSDQFAKGEGQLAVFCAYADVCPGDVTADGNIDVDDLVEIILRWGPCGGCAADINGDGFVTVDDLVEVILSWGPCL